ncbi:MAG: Asp23/Gls24 family envelope stress response protein [Anaerococcus sp.]|uniref:Asp23/Gls24 family envelope stress response protein n=1 Tax=Anaerococcus sp. TaxID=1872515 RepID=UPI002635CC6A|nr:Asp23/Gls24 family envelope stress response protein [Anaerococcus sp.]MCI5971887.1 Asp23/Gls24 family envelope stress response protein [Anaerococcus sp.]MDD6919190.1 Asp23/Gls24 family envelope stress response protein [Peptoniphilaceae bacterium]MDY2927282.1 Asp23/Gls24 family envelope stress response protein [Anaerococcus sp.]
MTEKKDRIEELNDGRELEYEESKLIIEDKVVAKIARIAINGVDGILEMKGNIADSIGSFFSGRDEQSTAGVSVEVGEKEAKINLDVIIEYGKNATRIFQDIKRAVTNNIKEMTGLDVVTVNVDVVDVMTKQEYEKKNRESNREREEQNRY